MRRQLSKEDYTLLKSMDYSVIDNDIKFFDDSCEFESDNPLLDVVFDVNIVSKGMDADQEECTEYGKKLYDLYDRLFLSGE